MYLLEVKHQDMKGVSFYVVDISINDEYLIYTTIDDDVVKGLSFEDKQKALNALKLVKKDLQAKKGYQVKIIGGN